MPFDNLVDEWILHGFRRTSWKFTNIGGELDNLRGHFITLRCTTYWHVSRTYSTLKTFNNYCINKGGVQPIFPCSLLSFTVCPRCRVHLSEWVISSSTLQIRLWSNWIYISVDIGRRNLVFGRILSFFIDLWSEFIKIWFGLAKLTHSPLKIKNNSFRSLNFLMKHLECK